MEETGGLGSAVPWGALSTFEPPGSRPVSAVALGWSCFRGGRKALVVLVVQAFALTLFMLGFFLTRHEVPHVSTCQDAVLWDLARFDPHPSFSNLSSSSSSSCWVPARHKRLVMIVIDALRYDFAQHLSDEDVEELAKKDQRLRYHINKLPVVQEHLVSSPSRSLLYRFEADPPTTTMQRLKGLTTGSLPTFLDLRQNFHSTAIAEDNIIHQLNAKGLRVVAMGDDTWELLFPGSFQRSFFFPSFNTRDLDTVDTGVAQHLLPEMRKGDFDVLVAHYLGVDHVGHTYGPSHPAMERKLHEMDQAIRHVISELQEDTLLVVMGDHGMTDDGNHGGATAEETGAALFLHSPQAPLLSTTPDGRLRLWRDSDGNDNGASAQSPLVSVDPSSSSLLASGRPIAQVDLVPTLSLLLGLPVPFASLGGIVPELFLHYGGLAQLADSLHVNARQVHRYLHKYSALARLPQDGLQHLDTLFHHASRALAAAASSSEPEDRERRLEEACRALRAFLREALQLGKRVWTQYDTELMLWGVALLAASLACLLLPAAPRPRALVLGLILGVVMALVASALLPQHFLGGNRGLAIPALVLLTTLAAHLTTARPPPLASLRPLLSVRVAGCLLLVALHGAALFSNSYLEAEDRLYLFFSSTAALLLFLPPLGPRSPLLWLLPCVVQRVSVSVKGHGQDVASHLTATTTLLPMAGLLLLHARQQRRQRWGLVAALCALFVGVLLSWLHEVEQAGGPGGASWLSPLLRLWLPRAVLVSSLLLAPVVFVLSLRAQQQGVGGCVALALRDVAMVGTAPLMLVLGPASPLSLLCLWAQLSLLRLARPTFPISPVKSEKEQEGRGHGEEAAGLELSTSVALAFNFIGRSYYYATGHHNQFNRLQYSAAFVGFDDFQFEAGGLLLALNTFGTELLGLLCLPWLLRPSPPSHAAWALQVLLACSGLRTLLTAVCVTVQRRHLMVWAIFAPKLIFDAALHLVTAGTATGLMLLLEAEQHRAGPPQQQQQQQQQHKQRVD